MVIIYCHHAERKRGKTLSQQDDLTDLGIMDAQLNAKILSQNKSIKAIYTSPFYRCKKTAEILNEKLNLPIIEDERLNEYKSFEGETWIDLQTRVMSVCNDIYEKYNDEDSVICVTSGVNVAGFICWDFNLTLSEKTPFIQVESCSPLGFYKKK